ncbi:hypothetical protein DM45_3826 [Burkholderia mallei]|nr:hypothetical protein DM45_3826 [Burkholderia mallei]
MNAVFPDRLTVAGEQRDADGEALAGRVTRPG